MSRYTWVHTNINQVIPTSDATPSKTLFFKIVTDLLSVPSAAIVSSCNSTATAASNLITSAAAVVYAAAGTAHSWGGVSFVNGGQMLITANNAYGTPGFDVLWSPKGLFTGGSTTANPTATDQLFATFYSSSMVIGGVTPWVWSSIWSTDGLRFHGTLNSANGITQGALSINYIDDPVDATVSGSPRGFAFCGGGWDFLGSIAWVGHLGTKDVAVVPISTGFNPTSLRAGTGLLAQHGANHLNGVNQMYTVDAFCDGSVVTGTGRTVGRLGTFADMFYTNSLLASDNLGAGVRPPQVAVLPNGERYAVMGSQGFNGNGSTGLALMWDSSDVKVFGDSRDISPTITALANIVDPVQLPIGASPTREFTWNTSKINQQFATDDAQRRAVTWAFLQILVSVDFAVVVSSNAIGSSAGLLFGVSGTAHSWAVIQFANGGQVLFTCLSSAFDVKWSPSGAYTGGTTLWDPTAPDEMAPNDNTQTGGGSITNPPSVLSGIWSTDGKRVRIAYVAGGGGVGPNCGALWLSFSIEVLSDVINGVVSPLMGMAGGWSIGTRRANSMQWVGTIDGAPVVFQAASAGFTEQTHGLFPAASVGDQAHFPGGLAYTLVGPSPFYTVWAFADRVYNYNGNNGPVELNGYLVGRFADMYAADAFNAPQGGNYTSTIFPKKVLLDNGEYWAVFGGGSDFTATAIPWINANVLTTGDSTDPATATVAGKIQNPKPPFAPARTGPVIVGGSFFRK